MATIREATQQDIEGIAALFNSDQEYHDPWFDTPRRITSRWDEMNIAKLVAVDGGAVVGFMEAETYYLVSSEQAKGKVAEVKKAFVSETHRGRGVASQLYDELEVRMRGTGFDFAIATAVCGHPESQDLFYGKGYVPAGFAPNFINADLTRTSPRESSLYVVKAIRDSGKKGLESRRKVYVPPEVFGVLVAAYSAAGLLQFREIVVDTKTTVSEEDKNWINDRLMPRGRGQNLPTRRAMLPHETMDIAKSERVSRVEAALEAGYVPVGVLPVGTDRIIMMYVPKGLRFNPSKVLIVPEARQLADTVGQLYNAYAVRS